ncbi:unnamed protein product, partial [Didymodactylos carnosus]
SQQALGFISTFQEGIKSSFSTSLTLITDTTQANGFLTVLETNYLLDYYLDRGFDTEILFYGNCSCGLSSRCLTEIGIWYNNSYILNITGLYVGCFITEALRQSNLVFFYNQSLLNQLQTDFLLDNDTSNVSVTALDPSLPTNYTPATTIGDILKMLMIEDWNSHISYESYFSTCQPISCTYNIIAHNSFIYIVTTAFGLIGGIATSLMFLIPLIVGFIHQRKKISAVPDDEINTGK